MSIKSDKWIRRMAQEHGMIEPFVERQVRGEQDNRVISFGVSSYGYDVRCADEFKVFTNINSATVDPKNFDAGSFVDIKSDVCIIPPNSFALARTVEYFRIPRDVLTICLGKSTYARCGIIVNVTPLEPEWEGHVTLEFSNTTTLFKKDLRQRRRGADAVLAVRRRVRSVVQGPWRQIPGPTRRHPAAYLSRQARELPAPLALQRSNAGVHDVHRLSSGAANETPSRNQCQAGRPAAQSRWVVALVTAGAPAAHAGGGVPHQPDPDTPQPPEPGETPPMEPGEPTLPDEPPPAPVA